MTIYINTPFNTKNFTHVCIGQHDLYFSYQSLVAYANLKRRIRVKTAQRFSVATSKHINNSFFSEFVAVPQDELHQIVEQNISTAYANEVK